MGVRFFFEEPGGVTVYRFDNGKYIKEEFLREVLARPRGQALREESEQVAVSR